MKRIVVDKNMLETLRNPEERHPLRAWLAASKNHVAVITDYAQLEMLKGNALKNILKSTEILAEFPKQVHILKPITIVSGLKGKKKALKKRLTSGGATGAFRRWCRKRALSAAGHKGFEEKIVKRGEEAALQLADMLEDMKGFADNIQDATAQFTTDELGILRRHEPSTEAIVLKIFDGTRDLADRFFMIHFMLHRRIKKPPEIYEIPYTFLYRFALCAFLHASGRRAGPIGRENA